VARPKTDEKEKLSQVILLRVNPAQMGQLVTASEACNQPIGELIRVKLFKGKFPQPVLARVDQQAVLELNRIGVNLNQVTKALNARISPKDILPVMTKLLWLLERILDELLTNDRKSKDR
jgi:hypothetical protein